MTKPTLREVNAEQEIQQNNVEQSKTEQGSAEPRDIFDNLESLRLTQDFQKTGGVKKLLTTIPVRKPNPQTFVRVHPEEAYRGAFAVIELKDDREIYLLPPEIAKSLPGEFVKVMLYTAITRQGDLFVWHVRLPDENGKTMEWWSSAMEAAERCMKGWLRIRANTSIGAYDMFEPEGKIPDPTWPNLSFQEILRIAFKGRLVFNLDHPVIKRLRGL